MKKTKLKLFNDPIYGFIAVSSPLIFNLIEHPYFQRLRRISQMGLSYLVYPGAHHTRFHHAIGCMHMMQKAIHVLRSKGISISDAEEEALLIAILLHDIGHGPFSHALEHSIIQNIDHEALSLLYMEVLNKEFKGDLTLAIKIFTGTYHREFMSQLVSGQLDMDRIDYLKRDSFYTGVAEGNINSERLITMLNVVDNQLVVEEKGIYSVEKFITARRLMYWQVYLHKTSLIAEQLLIRILRRVKELMANGEEVDAPSEFLFFLKEKIVCKDIDKKVLDMFSNVDDYDVFSAMKSWQYHSDYVLSKLSEMLLHRKLLKIKLKKRPIPEAKLHAYRTALMKEKGITIDEAAYFVFSGTVENTAYTTDRQRINIQTKSGKIKDVVKVSDHLNLKILSKPVTKYYLCRPKDKELV